MIVHAEDCMSKIRADLALIEILTRILGVESSAELDTRRANLEAIRKELQEIGRCESVPESDSPAKKLLSEFLSDKPELSGKLATRVVREILAYVQETCEHYSQIKARRPLTDQEKQIAPELLACLDRAQAILQSLSPK
jgi:hypothetical protein